MNSKHKNISKNISQSSIIAGLDIGSSKVAVVIASVNEENQLEIVGVGTAPNSGMKQGVVVNIESTAESIRKAREEAELMSGYRIEEVYVAVSGSHIRSFDSRGMVAIKDKTEINQHDVDRVIEAAKAVAVPSDRAVLHVIPRGFNVDEQTGILDPVGMSGVRLEANVHIVTGAANTLTNTIKCIEKAGLRSVGMVLDQLASGYAVLSEDERSLGVCIVDMGAGACNIAYYVNGSVAHTSLIPVGGQHFTHDIAIGLRTPQLSAEELKIKHASAMSSLVDEEQTVEVEGVGGRKSRTVMSRDLAEVVEPRAEEVLQLIAQDIRQSGLLPFLGSGVVLTGGASQLNGLVEMGEFVLDIPVRKGVPAVGKNVGGLIEVVKSPSFATAVGIVLYSFSQKKFTKAQSLKDDVITDSLNTFGHKVKGFFDQLF